MAAISNQDKAWKQIWMLRLEKITDIWDIVKAACGRSAEVVLSFCMFAQLIGVLPGVHYWPWVDNFILAVQVIMLDMGAFALHTLAEQARENGQEDAAEKADKLGTFLIRLMITTIALIIIGQVSVAFGEYAKLVQTIVSYTEIALILVRVVSTVRFIHVIHSLRGSTLSVQPTEVVPQPEAIDYEELARQLLPQLRNDLQALLPELHANLLPAPRDTIATIDATPARRTTQQLNEIDATTSATKTPVRVARSGAPTARQKALKMLARNPDMDAPTLARKADITPSYARKILAEVATEKGN